MPIKVAIKYCSPEYAREPQPKEVWTSSSKSILQTVGHLEEMQMTFWKKHRRSSTHSFLSKTH